MKFPSLKGFFQLYDMLVVHFRTSISILRRKIFKASYYTNQASYVYVWAVQTNFRNDTLKFSGGNSKIIAIRSLLLYDKIIFRP